MIASVPDAAAKAARETAAVLVDVERGAEREREREAAEGRTHAAAVQEAKRGMWDVLREAEVVLHELMLLGKGLQRVAEAWIERMEEDKGQRKRDRELLKKAERDLEKEKMCRRLAEQREEQLQWKMQTERERKDEERQREGEKVRSEKAEAAAQISSLRQEVFVLYYHFLLRVQALSTIMSTSSHLLFFFVQTRLVICGPYTGRRSCTSSAGL